jgi:EAL domain-containing protein (putative c-di-GMP-specific phosphodiesterase class I)
MKPYLPSMQQPMLKSAVMTKMSFVPLVVTVNFVALTHTDPSFTWIAMIWTLATGLAFMSVSRKTLEDNELRANSIYPVVNPTPQRSDGIKQINSYDERTHSNHDERLTLFCQPIVAVNGNNRIPPHFEILLRVKERDGRWVSPSALLPEVEHFGLSLPLDNWVIGKTFQWLWDMAPEDRPRVSINLSAHSINDPDLLEFIKEQLRRFQLDPSLICFEISEAAAVADKAHAKIMVTELTRMGCLFALDDFGTGVCSYSYLRELPSHYLKIDRSFLRNIHQDETHQATIQSINTLAHAVGKKTIAGYVEDANTLDLLTQLGVDYVQGYYLGKPKGIEAIEITTFDPNDLETRPTRFSMSA